MLIRNADDDDFLVRCKSVCVYVCVCRFFDKKRRDHKPKWKSGKIVSCSYSIFGLPNPFQSQIDDLCNGDVDQTIIYTVCSL